MFCFRALQVKSYCDILIHPAFYLSVHSMPENGIGTGNPSVLSGSSRRALQRSNSAEDLTPTNQKVGHGSEM